MLLSNIITGWKNYLTDNKKVEDIAKKKAMVCAICPNKKESKVFGWVKGGLDIEEIDASVCGLCDCPIAMLVRSNKKCKANKWGCII